MILDKKFYFLLQHSSAKTICLKELENINSGIENNPKVIKIFFFLSHDHTRKTK